MPTKVWKAFLKTDLQGGQLSLQEGFPHFGGHQLPDHPGRRPCAHPASRVQVSVFDLAVFRRNASESHFLSLVQKCLDICFPGHILADICLTSPGIVGKRCCSFRELLGVLSVGWPCSLAPAGKPMSSPDPKKGFTSPAVQLQACGQLHAHPEGPDTPAPPSLALQAALQPC